MRRTYEIREWTGNKKLVVKDGLPSLKVAFVELGRIKKDNPQKVYSIFRSPRDFKEVTNG